MNASEIEAGQTIAHESGRTGRRSGLLVRKVERVSDRSVYVYGTRVRLSDGAHLGSDRGVLLAAASTVEIIEEGK